MKNILLIVVLAVVFSSCKNHNIKDERLPSPLSTEAGLAKSMAHLKEKTATRVPSQFFSIDAKRDTILVSNKGSWLEIPANNFTNGAGEALTGNVQLELVEVHTIEEAMQTGLTTMTLDERALETAGMFFVNVTSKEATEVEYKKPVQFHTHTNVIVPNLELFEGKWVGEQLLWDDPQPIAQTMTKIPYDLVLESSWSQQGYEEKRNYDKMPYYSQLTQIPQVDWKGCPIYIIERELINNETLLDNTWIATEDFKLRLEYIYACCVLEPYLLYVEHINEPLWEVDEMVADFLEQEKNPMAANFRKLAALKKTYIAEEGDMKREMKSFASKIRQGMRLLENAKGLDYPVSLSIHNNGWANLDFYLSSLERPMTIENTIVNIELKVSVKKTNIPKGTNLSAYLLFKDWNSAFMLEQSMQNSMSFFQNITKLYKNTAYLVLVRDTEGDYAGIAEGTITDSLIVSNIVVKPLEQSQKETIEHYMKTPYRVTCLEINDEPCCSMKKTNNNPVLEG